MTLHDYAELLEYWADHPPTHLIAAVRAGIKPQARPVSPGRRAAGTPPARHAAPADLGALLGAAPNGIGSMARLKALG